ncbi:MAG: ABC transporter permease [Acidobacteriota bacterium]
MGAIGFATFTMSGRGDPEQYTGSTITPSLMPLLGLSPVLGRGFSDGEDRPGAGRVVIISDALWRRRFGADLHVIGQAVTLNGIADDRARAD